MIPYCTACGALRAPLSSPSVNLAGKPSRAGGAFASVLGWLVLVCGGSLALAVVLLSLAFHALSVGLAIAVPIAVVDLVIGLTLVRSGRSLSTSGVEAARSTREQALLAVAAHRGSITAVDAARALGVGVAEADALLTALAKREPDRVAVDVDDDGVVWYRVSAAPGEPIPRIRVGEGVRVGAPGEVQAAVEDVQGRVASRAPR
ncbi:MAG TPA: hypothetical protein VHS09_05310 [Polyangiaceae bacterium]|nr:hypothetical protein [Polyangiaceae bacterium]